jgi:hypothetical protein
MRKLVAVLSVVWLACGLGCESGGLHDPPLRHPDGEAQPPREDGGRFAQPPAGLEGREYQRGAAESPAAPAPPRVEAPAAAEDAPAPRGGIGGAAKRQSGAADEAEASASSRGSAPSGAPLHRPEERRERSGLATHWGETRYSPAHEVSFERDGASPTASAELHYNDRDGARRLLPGGYWCQSEVSLLGGALRARMLDSSGRPFSALCASGRVVSTGNPGERYSLAVENRTGQRYEVVATVDGLDVLDGEDGSYSKRGYLINAYSSVEIDGFRRSEAEVAAFRLGDVARSYAASKGKARNVGVIGFALFAERQPVVYAPRHPQGPWEGDSYLRSNADPFPGRYAQPPR